MARSNIPNPIDSQAEHDQNQDAWLRYVLTNHRFVIEAQMAEVGCSVKYDDRPRYWIVDGEKVYASLDDYILDGLH